MSFFAERTVAGTPLMVTVLEPGIVLKLLPIIVMTESFAALAGAKEVICSGGAGGADGGGVTGRAGSSFLQEKNTAKQVVRISRSLIDLIIFFLLDKEEFAFVAIDRRFLTNGGFWPLFGGRFTAFGRVIARAPF